MSSKQAGYSMLLHDQRALTSHMPNDVSLLLQLSRSYAYDLYKRHKML